MRASRGHEGDQLFGDLIGIEVEEADPEVPFALQHLANEVLKSCVFFALFAVVSQILGDEDDFMDALREERIEFFEDSGPGACCAGGL